MPERPDLRQIAGDIRVALDGYDRDALAEILTYVFKEYVVQSPPPLVAAACEQIADLEGLSFAELITALQTRLDVPELALFQVNGAEVTVRVNGVLTPLSAREARAAVEPLPPPAPVVAAPRPSAPAPTGRQTVDEAVSRGRGDLVGAGPTPIQPPPPRPGGLRVSGRTAPTPGGGAPASPRPAAPAAPAPGAPAPAAPNPPASAAPPAAPAAKPDAPDDDDASVRFSLLELD